MFEAFGVPVNSGQGESDKRTSRSEGPDIARLLVGTRDIPGGSFGKARRDDLADRRIRVSRLATGDQILVRHMHPSGAGAPGGDVWASATAAAVRPVLRSPHCSSSLHRTVRLGVRATQSTDS